MGTYSPETEMLNLRWGSHQLNLISVFDRLLGNQVFVDVTLACEGISLKVHKAVISAASPYFQKLLMENPCDHPVIILSDLQPSVLQDLVEFMYRGEINVMQDRLNELIKWAEKLQIAGLTETCQGGSEELPPEAATNETRTIYANNSQEFLPQQLIMKTNDINSLVHECRRKRHSTGSYRSEDPEFENGAASIKQRTAQGDSSDALNLCSNSDVITIAGSKQDVGGVQVGTPTSATVVHAEHIYTNTSMELTDNYQNSVTTHSWTPSHVEGGIYLVTEAAAPAKSHLERASSTPEVGESVIRQSEPLTATVVSAPTQQFHHPCSEPQETTETFLTTCGYATTTMATTSSASQTAGTVSVVVEQSPVNVNVAAVAIETGSSASSSSVCHICKKVLTSDRYMKAHLKRHDPSRNVHPCPWCTCTYRGRSELLRHQKLKHPDKLYDASSKLKSEAVSEATSASSSAAAQASSSSVDQFQMSSADFNQATANAAGTATAGKPILSFLRTQNQPSTSNTSRTKKPTVKTASNDGENSAGTDAVSAPTENTNSAVCPICKKCLTSNRYMKVHLKTHDPVRKLYPCNWCTCVYKGRSELLRHRKTKHPEHMFGK
ncbi:hypothetical protein CHUAL_008756 [Chamberlinius hualienensis]